MPYDEEDAVIARFYDTDYGVARTPSGDVDFYVEEAKRSGGPVLEFGCGTGRILGPTAAAGVEVVGVDASEAMLARLKEKHPEIEAHRGDMRTFDVGRKFALVTIPFRAIAHVEDEADHVRLFANMHRHLAPGGRLIFDVFQPNPKFLAGGLVEEQLQMEYERDGQTIRRYHRGRSSIATQVTTIRFRWEVEDPDTSIGEYRTEFRMRWFYRYELVHALARAGLAVEAIHGDFDRSELRDDSKEMIFVCRPD